MIQDRQVYACYPPRLALAILLVFTAPAAFAAEVRAAGVVRVEYVQPEKFTDLRDGYVTTDGRRAALLEQLTQHIEKRAAARIPAGSMLAVTISDIDMAGAFEPLRGGSDRVRILREIYPPRIKLQFRLADAKGVLKEGQREITNLAYLGNLERSDDLLRHEKKLLDDWLEREFSAS